jgi:DNA-binding winged helix-turn-helix (wHTH) protein
MDGSARGEAFLFEGFRFDRADGYLLREDGSQFGERLTLGSRAAALLATQQGKLVTKDEIFAAVWPGSAVEEANLTVQISALRRILDQGRAGGSCIQTVHRQGYRFVPLVTRTTLPPLAGPFDADPAAPADEGEGNQNSSSLAPKPPPPHPALPRHRNWAPRGVLGIMGAGLLLAGTWIFAFNWYSLYPKGLDQQVIFR